jgi:hypothetical protein
VAAQLLASRVVLSCTELVSQSLITNLRATVLEYRGCVFVRGVDWCPKSVDYVMSYENCGITVTHTGRPAVLPKYLLIKNGVFWDVTPCGSCKNRRFGGT